LAAQDFLVGSEIRLAAGHAASHGCSTPDAGQLLVVQARSARNAGVVAAIIAMIDVLVGMACRRSSRATELRAPIPSAKHA